MGSQIKGTIRVVVAPVIYLNKVLSTLAKYMDRRLKPAFSEFKIFVPLKETPSQHIIWLVKQKFDAEITWMATNIFPRRTRSLSLRNLERVTKIPVPKSINIVGDLLLINELPDKAEGHEYEIGEVLLRNFGVRAVFLKSQKVSGIERIATWYKLAGWGDTFTVHKENSCWYALDISKVFFNPRLGSERLRVTKLVQRDEVVIDMFAGVGPFAILIRKLAGAHVYAIDINRYAVEFMKLNSKLNKVDIFILEGDARLKVEEVDVPATRIIMNYPKNSISFIDSALRALRNRGFIHLYVFCDDDEVGVLIDRISNNISMLGRRITNLSARAVSEVAPRRYLYCLDIEVS